MSKTTATATNTTKATFRIVTIPEVTFTRTIEGESYSETAPGATVKVPFSHSNAHAIKLAMDMHRAKFEIPSSVTVMPRVATVPLVVGTTVPSKSGQARIHGKLVTA